MWKSSNYPLFLAPFTTKLLWKNCLHFFFPLNLSWIHSNLFCLTKSVLKYPMSILSPYFAPSMSSNWHLCALFFFSFFKVLLKYSWLTVLWSFLIYNKVMHTSILFQIFQIDYYRILGRILCALQQVPVGQSFHILHFTLFLDYQIYFSEASTLKSRFRYSTVYLTSLDR